MANQKMWNLVGKIKEARGLRGEVYVLLFPGEEIAWRNITVLGLGDLPRKGSVQFVKPPEQVLELDRQRPFKDGIVAKLRGCDDRNMAEEYRGRGVYVRQSEVVAVNPLKAAQYVGYRIQEHGVQKQWGKVLRVMAQAGQELMTLVDAEGVEREIPYVESWIKNINSAEKTMTMIFPEGLFELNVNGADD